MSALGNLVLQLWVPTGSRGWRRTCGGVGVGGPGLLPALGVLLREVIAIYLFRILSGAGLASPQEVVARGADS